MLDLLAMVARRWRILTTTILVSVALAAGITHELTPTYRASAQLFVALESSDNPSDLAYGNTFTSQRVKSYPDLVDSPLVLGPVIDDLQLDTTPEELGKRVAAEVSPNTVLIQVFVDDSSPVEAANIANAVSGQLATVVEDLDRTSKDRVSPVRVSVTREAVPPSGPRSPIPALNITVGFVLGVLLGIALAALREALDTSIKDERDIFEATGLPTVAQVPTNTAVGRSPVIGSDSINPVWAESYRKLRTNLSYIDPDNPARVIVVASALPGDGKSLTAANVAASMTQGGKRCVLVEADLRRPSLSRLLEVSPDAGVTTVVTGKTSLADAMQTSHGFDVLVSGPIPPNPSELLGTQAFAGLLATLRSSYDVVVVDTPPLIAVTDAAVAATVADAVLFVVRAKHTSHGDVRRALASLQAVDAKVVGVVINQVAFSALSYYQRDYQQEPGKRMRR